MAIKHYELWAQYKRRGSTEARAELIREHVPLVHHVINRMALNLPSTLGRDDLAAIGTLGLISAVQTFDLQRGIEFSTFAVPRIRGAILDELRRQDWVPRTTRRRAAELSGYLDENVAERRAPDLASLARRMKIPARRLSKMLAKLRPVVFLSLADSAPETDGDNLPASQTVADPRVLDPQKRVELAEQLATLRTALDALPRSERDLIVEYYFENHEQKDIAQRLRVSRSRVSQIHSHALLTLRKQMQALGAA